MLEEVGVHGLHKSIAQFQNKVTNSKSALLPKLISVTCFKKNLFDWNTLRGLVFHCCKIDTASIKIISPIESEEEKKKDFFPKPIINVDLPKNFLFSTPN